MSVNPPSRPLRKAARPRRQGNGSSARRADPTANAVPFKVTAFAAAVFEPPAISDAVEDAPVFDKSKAKRVVKTKAA
jgi:hypothetical protein